MDASIVRFLLLVDIQLHQLYVAIEAAGYTFELPSRHWIVNVVTFECRGVS